MRLFFLIFSLAATVLAGMGVTAALAAGLAGWQPIVGSAAIGAVLAIPAAWIATGWIRAL
ncbi:CTP synthetase [Rhodobacterales bacterium HKCCSP123]|nr:CTP synthetase [Rhodobacterales bacterium HKCCSP123]